MPTLTVDVEVEVGVWCATCGAGNCHLARVHRNGADVEVEVCETCVEKINDEHAGKIADKNEKIDRLKSEVDDLERQLNRGVG